MKKLIDRAYDQCAEILKTNESKLMEVVDFLMAHENMTGDQFAACMEGKEIDTASSTSLFDGFEAQPEAPAVEDADTE